MSLWHILENVVEGKEPVSDLVSKVESEVGIGITVAENAVELFAQQFLTPFGSQALSLAGSAVGQLLGGNSIQAVAASITPQIVVDAVTDAEKAGSVVLDALRVQLTAAKAQSVTPTAPDPEPTPDPTAAS